MKAQYLRFAARPPARLRSLPIASKVPSLLYDFTTLLFYTLHCSTYNLLVRTLKVLYSKASSCSNFYLPGFACFLLACCNGTCGRAYNRQRQAAVAESSLVQTQFKLGCMRVGRGGGGVHTYVHTSSTAAPARKLGTLFHFHFFFFPFSFSLFLAMIPFIATYSI